MSPGSAHSAVQEAAARLGAGTLTGTPPNQLVIRGTPARGDAMHTTPHYPACTRRVPGERALLSEELEQAQCAVRALRVAEQDDLMREAIRGVLSRSIALSRTQWQSKDDRMLRVPLEE